MKEYVKQISLYQGKKQPGRAYTVSYKLEVFHHEEPLFIVEYPELKISSKRYQQDVIEVFDKSGCYELLAEFLPSEQHLRVDFPYLRTNNPETKIEVAARTGQDFEGWFKQIIAALGGSIYLVPDTNFLRRQYFTNYFDKISPNPQGPPFRFTLSRLTIIEVESKYNRGSETAKSTHLTLLTGNHKPEKKKEIEETEWDARKEIRVAFHTTKEIMQMRRKGAGTLQNVNLDLLRSFSEQAGKGYADPWIRRELLDFKDKHNVHFVLLTSDMMSASVAVAENINALYLSRTPRDTFHADTVHLAELIINTAIHFGDCECVLNVGGDEKKFKLIGMWPGKSMNDWLNDAVLREGDDKSWLE